MSEETQTHPAVALSKNLGIDQMRVTNFVSISLIKGLMRLLYEKGIASKEDLTDMIEKRIEMENKQFQSMDFSDKSDEVKALFQTEQDQIVELLKTYFEGISKI